MGTNIRLWLKYHQDKVINSIAFYPVIMASGFLALSILSITFDFSEMGMQMKSHLQGFSLRDASTARSNVLQEETNTLKNRLQFYESVTLH